MGMLYVFRNLVLSKVHNNFAILTSLRFWNTYITARSKLSLHDEIINRVASKLGVHDPTKIRLTPHGHHKPSSITYTSTGHLSDILVDSNQDQTSNILFYEVFSPKAGPNNSATQAIIPSSCTICLDAPLEGACIPCGHMAGCMSCLKDIKDKKWGCPVCRAKIQQVVRIYTA